MNTLLLEPHNGVLHITLNRPQSRNAMSLQMVNELRTVLAQLDSQVRAVVISGPLAPVGSPLLDPIGRAMSRHAHPAMGPRTVLAMSQLGDRAEALGAAALAAHATAPVG